MKWNNAGRAVKHKIWVKIKAAYVVSSLMGRDMLCITSFYLYQIPNGMEAKSITENYKRFNPRAVRHKIWVKIKAACVVSSRTGRDMLRLISFYPYQIPNGKEAKSITENYQGFNPRAARHKIWVKIKAAYVVSSRTGRDMLCLISFYPYQIPNGMGSKTISENYKGFNPRAVRHKIWVKIKAAYVVSSRMGRDMLCLISFYPYQIPNGMEAKTISENYKELSI